MKTFIIIVFFGFCSSEVQLKTEADCSCLLRLSSGHVLETIKLTNDSIVLSDQCNNQDFSKCSEECTQKISNETNGYNLDEPKAEDQNQLSLGQMYCNKIGEDVRDAKFMLFVTLQCRFQRDVKEDRNGTAVTIGTSISESSITRYIDNGFKQKIRCVDNKYTKIE